MATETRHFVITITFISDCYRNWFRYKSFQEWRILIFPSRNIEVGSSNGFLLCESEILHAINVVYINSSKPYNLKYNWYSEFIIGILTSTSFEGLDFVSGIFRISTSAKCQGNSTPTHDSPEKVNGHNRRLQYTFRHSEQDDTTRYPKPDPTCIHDY